jgi:hypothetical protein
MSKPVLKAASTTVLDINGCPLTGGDWPEATG